jgi:hypothetical protein
MEANRNVARRAGVGCGVVKGRQAQKKQFFFEKKNQKTFVRWFTWPKRRRELNEQKFFVFFQKRNTCFLTWPPRQASLPSHIPDVRNAGRSEAFGSISR